MASIKVLGTACLCLLLGAGCASSEETPAPSPAPSSSVVTAEQQPIVVDVRDADGSVAASVLLEPSDAGIHVEVSEGGRSWQIDEEHGQLEFRRDGLLLGVPANVTRETLPQAVQAVVALVDRAVSEAGLNPPAAETAPPQLPEPEASIDGDVGTMSQAMGCWTFSNTSIFATSTICGANTAQIVAICAAQGGLPFTGACRCTCNFFTCTCNTNFCCFP